MAHVLNVAISVSDSEPALEELIEEFFACIMPNESIAATMVSVSRFIIYSILVFFWTAKIQKISNIQTFS